MEHVLKELDIVYLDGKKYLVRNGKLDRNLNEYYDCNVIVRNVCKAYNVSVDEIKSHSVRSDLYRARKCLVYMLSNYTSLGNEEICSIVNKKRHAVNHALLTFEDDLRLATITALRYKNILDKLRRAKY